LGLLSEALEPSPLVCAIYPSLLMLMLLVLVAEGHRVLDRLPVSGDDDERILGSPALGFGLCDRHTGPLSGSHGEATAAEDPPG
jgi:hypothetical protein